MRPISILSALGVVLALYLVVMERPHLVEFASGDTGALGRTALAQGVRGAFGAEPDAGADPDAAPPGTARPTAPPPPAVTERTVAVVSQISQARPIDRAVVLRGRTEASRQVAVRAETSGRVISEPARRGASVAEGAALCEIDPGNRPALLAEARARLAEAELNARAAERLSEGGFASDLRAAGATASLQSAAAAVAAAEQEIDRLVMRAPFAGILETDTAELGALLQPGALCATVIQLDPIRLVGFVPETEVDRIEVGARAGGRLTSGREVSGTVTFLSRAADPATRTFRVEITLETEGAPIRDGQTAEIGIQASGSDAHLVPGSALTLDDDGRLGLRLVGGDARAAFAPVEVVRDTQRGIWVTGLPDTAEVIVVGQEFVRDGVRVDATRRAAADAGADTEADLIDAVDAARDDAPATEPGR
ncbi:efflux RND transporter periplasmic adaptor subunit [Rhodobaculum claviforme]|uniref:CusB-like beta-barrel domain-containing protein n=1 Tax=Rhodobaculum claviforme TaxID=1549854 RepID=A0A934TJ17_9RHOB|nr:efflux RND transporter periplasmic adaptor subunit [Rhodobaculum claviforme]MBK5926406.1 hypothetical protein [Rhodobaculum claviforme]